MQHALPPPLASETGLQGSFYETSVSPSCLQIRVDQGRLLFNSIFEVSGMFPETSRMGRKMWGDRLGTRGFRNQFLGLRISGY